MNHLVAPEQGPAEGSSTGNETIAVATFTLDAVCARAGISEVDLLKLDIQGHEPAALRGAHGLLEARAIRTMLLELNWGPPERSDSPADECVARLAGLGYRFAGVGEDTFREAGPWLRGHADVFATLAR